MGNNHKIPQYSKKRKTRLPCCILWRWYISSGWNGTVYVPCRWLNSLCEEMSNYVSADNFWISHVIHFLFWLSAKIPEVQRNFTFNYLVFFYKVQSPTPNVSEHGSCSRLHKWSGIHHMIHSRNAGVYWREGQEIGTEMAGFNILNHDLGEQEKWL